MPNQDPKRDLRHAVNRSRSAVKRLEEILAAKVEEGEKHGN